MELGDLKKFFWAFVIISGLGWYVSQHYTFKDVLNYSRKHPSPGYSPMIDYYAGMGMYMRDDLPGSIEAFQQLLTDYPTCQYAPKAMFRMADAMANSNRYQEAREILEKYLEEYPNDRNRRSAEAKYEFIKFK